MTFCKASFYQLHRFCRKMIGGCSRTMTQNIMLFLSVCLMTLLFAGFRGWDCEATGVDINDELAQIANRAALGEEGPNGQYS